MKKLFYVLIVPLLLLAGCTTTNTSSSEKTSEVPTTSEVKPTSIEITSPSSQTTILVGETLQLNAAVSPSGASQSVTWSSSSDALATVSNNGLVTAVAPGNVIITAKSVIDTTISGEYALIVEEAPVVEVPPTSITVTGETTVKVGETISLSISVLPENAVDTVTWATSNEEIASVSNRGVVKGMAEGSVTITATSTLDTNVKGTLNVSVEGADIPDPTIDWETVEYTTHDEFVNMEADTPVKVKGVVTAVSNVKDNQINYYIQNGTEGFYVYAQNATYYPVEVGKSYEIGGFYKYYFTGTHEVVDVEYFKVLEEDIVAEINDLSEVNIAALDETTPLYGSLVKGEKFVVTSVPSKVTSSFNLGVTLNGNSHTMRIDSTLMSDQEFEAIGERVSALQVGQTFDLTKGIMSAYGYGTPKPQILVLSADDIVESQLTPQQKVDSVKNALHVRESLDNTVTQISLPTTFDGFDGVTISWQTSNDALITTAGVVTHPERDTLVKLTATIACEDVSEVIEYNVNVLASDDSYYSVVHTLDLEDALPAAQYATSASKSGYDEGNIDLGTPNATWMLRNALIGQDTGDVRNGEWSIRIQSYPNSTLDDTGRVELKEDLSFNTVELRVSAYGSDPYGTYINIAYSTNSGETFVDVIKIKITEKALNLYRVSLPETANRVSIYQTGATARTRANIDDIRLLNA